MTFKLTLVFKEYFLLFCIGISFFSLCCFSVAPGSNATLHYHWHTIGHVTEAVLLCSDVSLTLQCNSYKILNRRYMYL